MVEWSIAPVLKTGGPKGPVGSNPTPSAMTLNRPQTLINTGTRVFGMAPKRPFSGQVSLKVSLLRRENQNSREGGHKAGNTPPLPINGVPGFSDKVLHTLKGASKCS